MIACDLGSNTLRIVEFDSLTCKRVRAYEKIVRTAKNLHLTGRIAEESKEAIFMALHEASSQFDFKKHKTFSVTTEAMRQAQNAQEILDEIEEKFGLAFRIITGEEEAYLTSLAIEYALQREGFDAHTYALFDLGGGSTEITFCLEGVKKSQSFPFGIVTLAERFQNNLEQGIQEALTMLDAFLFAQKAIPTHYKQLVATAGTPTTVAAFLQGLDYAHYDSQKINGYSLHVKDFNEALYQLTQMNPTEAERYTGTNRRDLVIVGIHLVTAIMTRLGFTSCIVMDDGLREGVAISNCNKAASS